MKRVFLSLGSNIQPEKNIPACLEILRQKFRVKKISSIYETDPVGPSGESGGAVVADGGGAVPGGGKFWNLAVEIETGLDPKELVGELRGIEEGLGRKREGGNKFAPRTIDLDLLPQAGYTRRAFIMIPLAEIDPEGIASKNGKTNAVIAKNLAAKARFRKVGPASVPTFD